MTKPFENKVTSAGTAKLTIDGKELELPVIVGTEKERAVDIAKLRAKTGCITHDEAFMNTGSTTSAITFLDGEAGILPVEIKLGGQADPRALRALREFVDAHDCRLGLVIDNGEKPRRLDERIVSLPAASL